MAGARKSAFGANETTIRTAPTERHLSVLAITTAALSSAATSSLFSGPKRCRGQRHRRRDSAAVEQSLDPVHSRLAVVPGPDGHTHDCRLVDRYGYVWGNADRRDSESHEGRVLVVPITARHSRSSSKPGCLTVVSKDRISNAMW